MTVGVIKYAASSRDVLFDQMRMRERGRVREDKTSGLKGQFKTILDRANTKTH